MSNDSFTAGANAMWRDAQALARSVADRIEADGAAAAAHAVRVTFGIEPPMPQTVCPINPEPIIRSLP